MLTLVRLAQLLQHNQKDYNRYQRSLVEVLDAEREANEMIVEVKAAIELHRQKGEALKEETQQARELQQQSRDDSHPLSTDKGKGKEVSREVSPSIDDDDLEDRGLPKTPVGEEHRLKRRVLQQRLRECNLVLHRVKFLQGDLYHVLGPLHSQEEDACYGAAEAVRRELLKCRLPNLLFYHGAHTVY